MFSPISVFDVLITVNAILVVVSQNHSPYSHRLKREDLSSSHVDAMLQRVKQLHLTTKLTNLGGSALFLSQDEGEAIKILGSPYHIRLNSKQTNGQFTLMESIVLPGDGPLLHMHYHVDEVFYIVQGDMQIYIHNQTVQAPQGSCVFAPRGIAHTFRNPSTTIPARVQFWSFPGGVEGYLEHASRALNQEPPNIDLFVRLAFEWGIEVIGPANWANN